MDIFSSFLNAVLAVFNDNPVAQTIGFIGYGISLYAFGFCKNKKFILSMAILSAFWAVHFYMIAAMSAFIVNFIDVFKAGFALKYGKNKKIACIFLILYIISGYFFYDNLYSLIPIFASIFGLYLTFYIRGIWLNAGYLFIVMIWFFYNMYHGSIGGVISDVTLFFTGIYGIITMFVIKNKKELEK